MIGSMRSYTTLYRGFDAEGNLLYVGVASYWQRRLMEHERAEWLKHTATVTLEHFETRQEALAAEYEAIKTEKPHFNATGGNRPRGTHGQPFVPIEPNPACFPETPELDAAINGWLGKIGKTD